MMDQDVIQDSLVCNGVEFLRSITETYGTEKGMELWDRMCEVLDPDVKGKVFFAMLTGSHHGFLTIRGVTQTGMYQKIPVIKAIRAAAGLGLKEAKDLTDELEMGRHVKIKLQNHHDYSSVRTELIRNGCIV